jgi:F0F1-type ATP synthase assembly protein I
MPDSSNRPEREYLKWAGAGVQMVVTIGIFVFIGRWLDGKYPNEFPLWTLILALVGCAAGLYSLIKSFLK